MRPPGDSERGSASVVMLALLAVLALLGAAIGAVGQYLAAHVEAATAADAAALAAAPVTFWPFRARGSATEEAARFAEANGARLVSCRCAFDPSWSPRTVEVEVERPVELLVFGSHAVQARSRAEFIPARLLGGDVQALLAEPRVVLSGGARDDLASGAVDPRVVALLGEISRRHSIEVNVIVSGHSKYVRGTSRVSNHYYGRAVDISRVDGEPVGPSSEPARRLVTWLAELEGPVRPTEVGSPFVDLAHHGGFFTDVDHGAHLHIGYHG
ncbi:MAG: pilus assembly protein TadG-related protein [Actinomycetota bacterium]|nr:pilus assembly protein TadG-related protein [Actinomycetota bacterium]